MARSKPSPRPRALKPLKPKAPKSTASPAAPRFAAWIDEVSARAIADALGISIWSVYRWRKYALGIDGGAVPSARRMTAIIQLSGGKLTSHDIYGGAA